MHPGGGSVAVKQVTRPNFNAALEGLRACVEESDFVAVDLEMTSVTSAPWRDSFEFDRSDVRYLKLKDPAEKFVVVQFGVCPFRWDSSKGSFFAHPHNFYIFPQKELPLHGPPDDFLWQATSIDFLAKYQFDFNACIYEGAFLNQRMKNKLHKWHDSILRSPDKAYIDKEDAGINNAQFQTVISRKQYVLEDLRKNTEKRIKSSVGFRHVVDLLASAGKLIVGHNCEATGVPICDGVRAGEFTPIGACGAPSWVDGRLESLRRFRRTSNEKVESINKTTWKAREERVSTVALYLVEVIRAGGAVASLRNESTATERLARYVALDDKTTRDQRTIGGISNGTTLALIAMLEWC
ncbi:hypothetical protein ZIOFF_070682 [Zingiber officinale]|uniref:Uncharacterized protein n=1 Tax=Zingiber officinale TaxID=94328 RepID=A0A8J5BDI4_ZINOF|nr:hypothetical protein ZIOFF_070682 [Zingiber officinale]